MNKHLNEGVRNVTKGMKAKPKKSKGKKVAGLPARNKARKGGG